MNQHDPQSWKEALDASTDAIILDVRTPQEWEDGIIPSAVMLDIYNPSEFMNGIAEMDKTKEYFVYCRAGARSAQACAILESQGFSSTHNLDGGITAWTGDTVMPDA